MFSAHVSCPHLLKVQLSTLYFQQESKQTVIPKHKINSLKFTLGQNGIIWVEDKGVGALKNRRSEEYGR